MKTHLLLTGLLSLLILGSCSTPLKVHSDYDKSIDFSKYKTFSLYKLDTNSGISELNRQRIANAIRNEMVSKGYQENTTSPDILVNQVAIFKDKVSVSSSTNYYGYGGVYRPYSWGGAGVSGYTNYNVQEYKEGSLIIDVIDASTQKLIWQGIGNKEIDGPVKDPDTKIPKAITMIMESFPPGKAKKS